MRSIFWTQKRAPDGALPRLVESEGSIFWHPFFLVAHQFPPPCEALAVWAWSNCVQQEDRQGRRLLRINLDETAVCMCSSWRDGFLVRAARQSSRAGRSLTRDFSRAEQRTNITHVALICDDAAIQPFLPQIILVSERLVHRDVCVHTQRSLPPCCVLLRRKKAWVTENVMLYVVKELRRRLLPWMHECDVILFTDAFRAHLTRKVLRSYGLADMRFVCIAGGLTWALQPLDTHVFAQYKRQLHIESQAESLRGENQKGVRAFLRNVGAVITKVLNSKGWASAFEDLGLCGHQRLVSVRLWNTLGFGAVRPEVAMYPSLAQLHSIFPKNASIPVDDVFAYFTLKALRISRQHARLTRTEGVESVAPVREELRVRSSRGSSGSLQTSAVASVVACPMEPTPRESQGMNLPPYLPNAKRIRRPRSWQESQPPLPPPAERPLQAPQEWR